MTSKRYVITITEHAAEESYKERQWTPGVVEPAEDNKQGYGYTPQVKEIKTVERKVYEQNVDALDIKAVIRAVNGDSHVSLSGAIYATEEGLKKVP